MGNVKDAPEPVCKALVCSLLIVQDSADDIRLQRSGGGSRRRTFLGVYVDLDGGGGVEANDKNFATVHPFKLRLSIALCKLNHWIYPEVCV